MANEDKRIHELDEATSWSNNDMFLMEDASTNVDKKIKGQNLISQTVIENKVEELMEEHEEWRAVVLDGSIEIRKLATDTLELIDSKAVPDGYYDEMAVGSAEQLLSNTYEEDNAPYLFRTSGGSLEIGDRVYEDAIVGGSVAWNQLVADADKTKSNNAVDDASGLMLRFRMLNSPYTVMVNYGDTSLGIHNNIFTSSESFAGVALIHTGHARNVLLYSSNMNIVANHKYLIHFNLQSKDYTTVGGMTIDDFYISDLTHDFGNPAIADYAYTLETSEEGSGIAWLKANGFFTKDYYPFNAGGIQSVKTSAKKVTGFNQWDEQWEVGAYNSITGAKASLTNRIRCKNKIHVLPNTTYYFYSGSNYGILQWYTYDVDENYIGQISSSNSKITTPNNCYYITFNGGANSLTTYNHDICINLHWDGERDGEYEPYVEYTYPLDSDLELRGIPKLVDGKIKYDGDLYASDGTVTRRYGIVDLGTLSWNYSTTDNVPRFEAALPKYKSASALTAANAICTKYPIVSFNSMNSGVQDKVASLLYANVPGINVYDTSYTDAATFKTAMSGQYLVYEINTPAIESADHYTSPQWVSNWGTEQFVDTRDVPIPVGHDSRYLPDLKAKLESAPNNPNTNGKYFLQYENGEATYVPVPSEVPQTPSEDGTYVLKATVASGVATLAWVTEE